MTPCRLRPRDRCRSRPDRRDLACRRQPPRIPGLADLRLRVDEEMPSGWEATVVDGGDAIIGFNRADLVLSLWRHLAVTEITFPGFPKIGRYTDASYGL